MRTTIGKILVNDALPPELRDHTRVLTSGETDKLLAAIGKDHPDKYRAVSQALMKLGAEASFTEGTTLSLSDMLPPVEKDRADLVKHVRQQTAKIMAAKDMTDDQKQEALTTVFSKVQKFLVDATFERSSAAQNPFALQVLSKARGNPQQLAALMTTPGIYTDAEDRIIPIFVERSYAEGLRPHEYWAGTYGARKGVVSTKFATRDAGYLGKQFTQSALRTIVTDDDCETASGIPVATEDTDSIGAVLARQAGRYPAGTVVSKEVLADIGKSGAEQIMVRSPLTCGMGQGVCRKCVGLRENGAFPKLGDHVGINAASALAERIAQGSLNVKHSGGMAKGDGADQVYAGFDVIEQLFQTPKTFPHRAAVASRDGRVDRIEEAPQGGWNVYVDDEVNYVLPETKLLVKAGDKVEAGDQLSSGLMNPREVVQYKGIGEGRRYFTERATQAFRDSGYAVNRRNMEVLTRGLIDHATVTDPEGAGDYLPGDVMSYNAVAANYRPRQTAQLRDVNDAVGGYLEQPVMHYTIGTRVTKKVAKDLAKFGHTRVTTDDKPPGFEPYMVGLRAVPQYEPDWMAQLGSSYLKANLLDQVHHGGESHIHGLNPIPGMAKGTEFGSNKTVGY